MRISCKRLLQIKIEESKTLSSPKYRPKSNFPISPYTGYIICGYFSRKQSRAPLKFPCKLANDVICNYAKDDTASIALPSGQAASTRAFLYLTFFTNVISCQGSTPVQSTKTAPKIRILLGFSSSSILHKLQNCRFRLPNPSTSNVYWYTRSMHKNGRLSSLTRGYMDLASTNFVSQACFAASPNSLGRTLATGTFGSAKPAYMFK